jgi:hypothetical protein
MTEMYWLFRLSSIRAFLIAIIIISAIIVVMILANGWDDDAEEYVKKWIKPLYSFVGIILFNLTALVFIPTTKEAFAIYGIGGTIDYLKGSKEAQKLPDKTIKVLNVFLDKEIKEESDSI